MIRAPFSVLLSVLLSFLINVQTCEDIEFDYPEHPYHPFDIEHAEISLDLESDQNLVNGSVVYSITSKIDGLTEIQLFADELSIDAVLLNDDEVEYGVSSDALIIQLSDTLSVGEVFNLTISWQSNSIFGLHQSENGTFWSSMNPLSHRHWLPGFDHPRETFTFETSIDIPNELEVLFNGELGETSPVSQSKKRVRWSSETEVPATGIGFVLGNFAISEMTAGFTKIRVFHRNVDQQIAADLIVEAARLKKEIEDIISFEYPWESLNIVILSDNYWMERTHGAGTIYLFERMGSLKNQLARNMYAQWFGEYQRTEQYLSSSSLLQSALHYQITDQYALIENPDSLWLINDWNNWQLNYSKEPTVFTSTVQESLEEIMREFAGTVSNEEYAELWYETIGVPFFDKFALQVDNIDTAIVDSASIYQVDIQLDEIDSELALTFELVEGNGDELYSITIIEHQFSEVTSQEISFTGELDTVSVSIPNTTEFITFESASFPLKNLIVGDSPLFFMLNQLRSENPENRVSAAKSLVQHADNPDLQLALSDILAFEENDAVKASIYAALAAITNGASGTEEQFIRELNNDSGFIQLAAIKALENYRENEYARQSLQSKLLRSENEVFEAALSSYDKIASTAEMESTLRSLQRRDTLGFKTMRLLEISDSLTTNEKALDVAIEFVDNIHPYELRFRALEYLNINDIDFDRWSLRLIELASDRDPRIRFWAVEHAPRFKSTSEALIFLNTVEVDEHDPRVLFLIQGVKEEMAE